MKKQFIYARYNKEDNCLGVYDSLEEAILKIYNINKYNDKFNQYKQSILSSIYKNKKNYNSCSVNGFWYQIEREEND